MLDRPLKVTTMFAVSRKLRSNFHNARFRAEREREKERERKERFLEWVTLTSIVKNTSRPSIYADHLLINSQTVNNGPQCVGLSTRE